MCRSKQKNMKRDTRPSSQRPGGSAYVAKTIVTAEDLSAVRQKRPKNLPATASTTSPAAAPPAAASTST